jgi:hypothetical protein
LRKRLTFPLGPWDGLHAAESAAAERVKEVLGHAHRMDGC